MFILNFRRKTAIEDLAVKPITKFPVEIEEEDEEEKYKNYPNVRSVTFRKVNFLLSLIFYTCFA